MKNKLNKTDLRAALESAKKELQELLTRTQHLREWIAVTEKLCSKRGKSMLSTEPAMVARPRRTKTAVLAGQVIEVLQAARKPMHVEEIIEGLERSGHPVNAKNPKATVAVALTRRTDQFRKVGPNTFDLAGGEEKIAS